MLLYESYNVIGLQVREGKVKNVTCKAAGELMQVSCCQLKICLPHPQRYLEIGLGSTCSWLTSEFEIIACPQDGWVLLDVRPKEEIAKVYSWLHLLHLL